MAHSLSEILQTVDLRVSTLESRLKAVEEENLSLRANLETTREKLADVIKERDRALLDVEFLTVSHRLADTPEALLATRHRISRMIRTLDKCISLLKEDPGA